MLWVTVLPTPGDGPEETIKEMIRLARVLETGIETHFNEIHIAVVPNGNFEDAYRLYLIAKENQ